MKDRKLADWLEKKYAEWQPTQDRKVRSVRAFAIYLGISQPLLTQLINANRNRISQDTADKIATALDDDTIYDLVDLPRPDPDLRRIKALWPMIREDRKPYILKKVEEAARDGQVPDSAVQTMAKARKASA